MDASRATQTDGREVTASASKSAAKVFSTTTTQTPAKSAIQTAKSVQLARDTTAYLVFLANSSTLTIDVLMPVLQASM
jgi:hypothetical protein